MSPLMGLSNFSTVSNKSQQEVPLALCLDLVSPSRYHLWGKKYMQSCNWGYWDYYELCLSYFEILTLCFTEKLCPDERTFCPCCNFLPQTWPTRFEQRTVCQDVSA